jgi:hypothetical protein
MADMLVKLKDRKKAEDKADDKEVPLEAAN